MGERARHRHSRFKLRSLVVKLDTRVQLIIIGIAVGLVSGLAAVLLNSSLLSG